MITIKQPVICTAAQLGASLENVNDYSKSIFLVSHIIDEVQNIDKDIWFSTSEEYGRFFSVEVADPFVVGILMPALQTGQDIEIDGCISEKLYYNLNNVIYLLNTARGGRRISVKAKNIINPDYHAKGVGCGCSLGVDSLSAILSHIDQSCLPSFRITHLTCFNVGAFGSKDLAVARASYIHDLELIKTFADEIKLPLVCIESNIAITHRGFSFDECGVLRNMATALTMQKLYGKYYYGSSRPAASVRFDKGSTDYYETLLLPLLSTENTELIVADLDKTRVEKTKVIVDNPLTQKHLYVCWKEIFKNEYPHYWKDIKDVADKVRNCTRCDKCFRTVFTIDLLGKLDFYKDIFDIPYYLKHRNNYIKKVLINKKYDTFYQEIYDLMVETNFSIPFSARVSCFAYNTKSIIRSFLSKIYHLFIPFKK